jgi:very-short-patch-repair endonuclease
LDEAGIVGWRANVRAEVADGSIEADVVFAARKLVVEIDGHGHRRAQTRRVDADRMRRLREAGWTVIRIPDWLVEWDLADAIERIRVALEATRRT